MTYISLDTSQNGVGHIFQRHIRMFSVRYFLDTYVTHPACDRLCDQRISWPSSNYCQKAAYEEVSIPCMALLGANLRSKAITKWESKRTTFGVLRNAPFKHRNATCMIEIRMWLRTLLHTDSPNGPEKHVHSSHYNDCKTHRYLQELFNQLLQMVS